MHSIEATWLPERLSLFSKSDERGANMFCRKIGSVVFSVVLVSSLNLADSRAVGSEETHNRCRQRHFGPFSDWSEPVNLGPVVNSKFNDQHPAISADGLSLYITSDRPGGFGDFD